MAKEQTYNYIQLRTDVMFAQVVRVDGKHKTIIQGETANSGTTYLDAERAKKLAFAPLEAAAHSEQGWTE